MAEDKIPAVLKLKGEKIKDIKSIYIGFLDA